MQIQTRGIRSMTRDFRDVSRPMIDAEVRDDATGSTQSHQTVVCSTSCKKIQKVKNNLFYGNEMIQLKIIKT